MNRTKFGSESLLITPFVYGTGKAIKAAATRGKRIEFSNSKLDQFFNKTFSALRARGAKPQEIFEAKMAETGATMADTNRAMELVKNIDRQVDTMFPTFKFLFDKSGTQRRADIYKELNDLLFAGNIGQKIPSQKSAAVYKLLKDNNASDEAIKSLFETLNGAKKNFYTINQRIIKRTKRHKNITVIDG